MYRKSLRLPKTDFPMRARLAQREPSTLEQWQEKDLYGQIRAARGSGHGRVWEPSVKLDQADTPAYRSFTAVGIDAAGAMHAIWIDSRHAPQVGAEEPADLFYARVDGDHVDAVQLAQVLGAWQ